MEYERQFEQIDGKCSVKAKQKFRFVGPDGSGDEHIIWIHEFDFIGDNSTYKLGMSSQTYEFVENASFWNIFILAGVAPTFACLQSCVGK